MKFTWDPKSQAETDLAEKMFRHAVEKPEKAGVPKAKAFKVKRGKAGGELKGFDRNAGEIALIFP